jgi:hypothetical protein
MARLFMGGFSLNHAVNLDVGEIAILTWNEKNLRV